jgi:hypothetical protein
MISESVKIIPGAVAGDYLYKAETIGNAFYHFARYRA